MKLGVIADTHGLLRPSALAALEGSDHILHAGDVGDPAILTALRELAPITAVRGNTDRGAMALLPRRELLELSGVWIYLHHGHEPLDLDPTAAGVRLVVEGHSHRPSLEQRRGVTYLNPGSAGRRRFALPVTLARVRLPPGGRGEIEVERIDLAS